MSDKHESKAGELYDHAHAEFPACGIAVVPWADVPECIRDAWKRALRAARAEAFEEAAAIARSTCESDLSDEDMEAAGDEAIEATARSIARRITEAKDKP